jgi:TRAP-type C4-dicarboxylate transport system substrate-binding protein
MLPVVKFARLNEVQAYCAMTYHIWDGLWLCINTLAWNRLPERLRNIVSNTLNGTAPRQREDSARMQETIRSSLETSGMTFPNVDLPSFRDALHRQGHYGRIRAKLGDKVWEVIQRSTGLPS